MKHFDEIYELAEDNYGIITSPEAKDLGVSRAELSRFVKAGWLNRIGNGVYKLVRHTPTPLDSYAEAVALVGPDSYIHGESVLAMCGLALASPSKTIVATNKRVRKTLPPWIKVIKPEDQETQVMHEGIPTQKISEAIRACRNAVLPERYLTAINDALSNGLISETEAKQLREEI